MRLFLLAILLFFSGVTLAQKRDTLSYNKQRPLTWDDFAIAPDLANDSMKAFLSVTIGMRNVKVNVWMGYGTYEAHAFAYRSSSWVKEGSQDSSTLRHQQYAFALTELVAKKLEKDINDAKINLGWVNKVNRIFANYDRFSKQCLYAYRRETENGQNATKQAEWEAMIDKDQLKLQIENSRK